MSLSETILKIRSPASIHSREKEIVVSVRLSHFDGFAWFCLGVVYHDCVLRCVITRIKETEVYFCAVYFLYDATQRGAFHDCVSTSLFNVRDRQRGIDILQTTIRTDRTSLSTSHRRNGMRCVFAQNYESDRDSNSSASLSLSWFRAKTQRIADTWDGTLRIPPLN